MEHIVIRRMEESDIPGAAAVEAAVLDGWSEHGIGSALASGAARCFVACGETGVAGFCACTLAAGEANVDAVSVHAAARRKGVGEALVRFALDALKQEGAAEVFLEVRSENLPARRLYEKLGFAALGVRRGFYSAPPDDAVVMRKDL